MSEMNAIFFTKRQFKKMKKCTLERAVSNTEGRLYIVKKSDNWQDGKKMLKYFYNREGEYFSDKLFTINQLLNDNRLTAIDALVLPTELAVVDGKVVGFLMPFIEGKNLLPILQSWKVPIEEKRVYLKQIGQLLKQVHTKTAYDQHVYFGDLHPGNFIVDKNKKVHAVDTDSFKVKNNIPFPSKYLSTNPNIVNMQHKYPQNEDGIHIPNKNSDLLCYVFTILNTISRVKLHTIPIDEYYTYLDYLSSLGFGDDFIRACGRIYTNGPNISPLPYLDQIPDQIYQAAYSIFTLRKKTKGKIK